MPCLLQINECLNTSTGSIARQIGDLVVENGWESYIAYSSFEDYYPCRSEVIPIGTKYDRFIHALETRLFDNHGRALKSTTKDLINEIKKINPSVIHLHNLHGYYCNYNILFSFLKDANIPVVWTFHDCWPFTGHCAFPAFHNCVKWQSACAQCDYKKEYPRSFVDNSLFNYMDKKKYFLSVPQMHIVTVSDWLKAEVGKSFFKGKDICRIYNGVDIEIFQPCKVEDVNKKYKINPSKKIVLGVANRWEPRKGLADFISLRKLLSDDFLIILVGINKSQKEMLPEGILAIERTDSAVELAMLYSLADVFVNPSYAETFGMTSIEALSCGTPVVVYNATACPEIVDNNTGRVVQPGDIEGVVKAINQLMIDKCFTEKKCRDRAVELFNKDARFYDYMNLYKSILGGG